MQTRDITDREIDKRKLHFAKRKKKNEWKFQLATIYYYGVNSITEVIISNFIKRFEVKYIN